MQAVDPTEEENEKEPQAQLNFVSRISTGVTAALQVAVRTFALLFDTIAQIRISAVRRSLYKGTVGVRR